MLSVTTLAEFKTFMKDNARVVVDFWAPWCPPCRTLTPLFEQASTEDTSGVVYVKVNIDEASEVADKFDIKSIPTVAYFKDGREVDRTVGLPSSLAVLKEAVAKNLP